MINLKHTDISDNNIYFSDNMTLIIDEITSVYIYKSPCPNFDNLINLEWLDLSQNVWDFKKNFSWNLKKLNKLKFIGLPSTRGKNILQLPNLEFIHGIDPINKLLNCFYNVDKKLIVATVNIIDELDNIDDIEELIVLSNEIYCYDDIQDLKLIERTNNSYANLPNTLKYLQIGGLNSELKNLPPNLNELKLINPIILICDIKMPYGCKLTVEYNNCWLTVFYFYEENMKFVSGKIE